MNQDFDKFCEFVTALLGTVDHTLEIRQGRKYAKLVSRSRGSGSVWAFVDKETGDILKPATFNAPAKHARGNIKDSETYKNYQWTGPHYLR